MSDQKSNNEQSELGDNESLDQHEQPDSSSALSLEDVIEHQEAIESGLVGSNEYGEGTEQDGQADVTSQLEAETVEADPAAHDDMDLGESDAPEDDLEEVEKGDPYGGHSHEHLSKILESALFASGATLSVSHLRDIFEPMERPHGRIVRQVMAELIASYEGRGVNLVEVASGYRFQTENSTAHWISRLWEEKPQRYSRALMETIALIAYRQPITRGEIEDVRGVAVSSNIIRTLLEREWVRVVGHRDVPGRPAMYATTRQFLDYFSLKSLDQLPSLSDIRSMEELNPQMELANSDEANQAEGESTQQSEITFDAIANRFALQAEGKTGSEFIDEQLDDELAAMDEVNSNFENALEKQRAEHEHPGLDLDSDGLDDDAVIHQQKEPSAETVAESDNLDADFEPSIDNRFEANETKDEPEIPELSEEEQWKIIQEKLAQQQALLDDRENDQSREDNDNE